jgi:hypothetical protein
MSSITNVNNNASVINVGRTTPVSPGVQPASKSIPVVMASDQSAIPVEEQNKVQSEVALSLLGIPRAEVALGIFADVNTYDVNPSEWSSSPEYHVAGHGIKHLPTEAGALVEAPRNKSAVLTSKRFFRYQPGRVSAATFGVKSTVSQASYAQNPSIRKFGIYDNFDGYFWESRNDGQEDNFSVVRRSQSMIKSPNSPFGNAGLAYRGGAPSGTVQVTQNDDYRIIGLGANESTIEADFLPKDRQLIQDTRFAIIDAALTAAALNYTSLATAIGGTETATSVELKCKRDLDYWIDFYLLDMKFGGDGHIRSNTTNYATAVLPAIATYERPVHAALRTALLAVSGLSSAGVTKLTALTAITTAAFAGSTIATQMSGASYGSKNKFETIMDAKSHYWAYVVSTKTQAGVVITYTVPASGLSSGLTADDIKYKCQRDVGYIVDGYKYDIIGGGNAHTKYNMSMYFRGTGMSIYSQDATFVNSEIARHTYLRDLIRSELSDDIGTNIGFGYTSASAEITKGYALATKVINNFYIENVDSMETGSEYFYGNLVALRDGLIVTHAAVYDASLLKDQIPIVAQAIGSNAAANIGTANSFALTSGHVTFGQHVRVSWSNASSVTTCGTLIPGTVYKVSNVFGPKGNAFKLVSEAGVAQTFTVAQATAAGTMYVTTVVPFIFPKDYNPTVYRAGTSTVLSEINGLAFPNITANGLQDGKLPSGMVFPYMYASDQNLLSTDTVASLRVGFINTALDLSNATNLNTIRTQIDNVNFYPEYINWIKNNVKPEYYGVYDYRVPRSRFSHDALNGYGETNIETGLRVYSDLATGETGTVRPGQKYTVDAVDQNVSSLYKYDFTKVTMLKIEFSWYGAVGALFLAYVPVENGEARWVRVHHLRASNQLKIASLGNATLPITYTTYGGGDRYSLGDLEDINAIDRGYNSTSHSVVKYGASYYIDGGDRGTVRLYSHNNEDTIDAYGKRWSVSGSVTTQTLDGVSTPALAISAATLTGPTDSSTGGTVANAGGTGTEPKFFMGARLKTNNRVDQSIRVIWANATHVFLSATPVGTSGFTLLPDRANTVFGLETKKVILSTREGNAVRNRVQVYPTKLSASNLGDNPVRLRLKKTPLFQFATAPSGTLQLSADYTVDANNAALAVTQSGTYLGNSESIYGWFRATVGVDKVSVFGRLYKLADAYYFELLERFNGTIIIKALDTFLADGRFEADGTEITATAITKSTVEKEGLSSILIASNTIVPIPNTGINVATIYLQQGTEQLDLSPYFDYNKEYLSFPLTDQADSLYFAVDSDRAVNSAVDEISLGCTWEEQ